MIFSAVNRRVLAAPGPAGAVVTWLYAGDAEHAWNTFQVGEAQGQGAAAWRERRVRLGPSGGLGTPAVRSLPNVAVLLAQLPTVPGTMLLWACLRTPLTATTLRTA